MPNIVVAGAGPIGLYTAILLRKRYPSVNVTVLDDRIGVLAANRRNFRTKSGQYSLNLSL